MANLSLIRAEVVARPNGTVVKRVLLLADDTPASLTITGADVPGMEADDVIASGSVLIAPSANYIAFEDGVFQEKE